MGLAQKKLAISLIFIIMLLQQAFAQFEIVQANTSEDFEIESYKLQNSPNFIINTYGVSHDFILSSNNAPINVCACSMFADQIFIRNNGNIRETYIVTTSSRHSALTANQATINPGETAIILNYITPGCEEFSDDLTITVQAQSSGAMKEMTQTLNSVLCDNINATSKALNFSTKPCTLITAEINITNPLDFTEYYDLSTDVLSEFITFSQPEITINPKETKKVFMYILPTCDVYGEYDAAVKISTQNTRIQKEIPLSINISKEYDYDITFPQNQEACNYITTRMPLTIKNNDNLTNSYTLQIQKSRWFTLETEEVELSPYQSKTIYLDVHPRWKETSPTVIYLKSKSLYGKIEKEYTIIANVKDCYSQNITYASDDAICFDDKTVYFKLQNTGNKKTDFEISTKNKELLLLQTRYSLLPGQSEIISAYLNVSDADKAYPLVVEASSLNRTFRGIAKKNVEVKSLGTCYKAKIRTPVYESYNYSGKVRNITITNTGQKDAKYSLKTEYPTFGQLSDDKVELSAGENNTVQIIFLPEPGRHVGIYPVKITAIESQGMLYYTGFMSRLYDKPLLQKASESIKKDIEWTKQNWKTATIIISIILGIIILAVIILKLTIYYLRKQDEKKKLIVRIKKTRKR